VADDLHLLLRKPYTLRDLSQAITEALHRARPVR